MNQRFERYVAEQNTAGARLGCILIGTLMPAGVVLDRVTHPEFVGSFLTLRLGASLASALLYLLTYVPWVRRQSYLVGAAAAFSCAVFLEVMVWRLEGYASPYYAGLNLLILSVGLLFTWRAREAAVICALIIATWLVPALLSPARISLGPFFNNLYFLVLTSVIAVWSNAHRYQLAHREWDARQKLTATTAELASTLDRLKELDRVKNEFFANISHELRTPLTLILAPVDEMLAAAEGAHATRLEMVKRNAERLLRLIDDLLDLARLEVGGLRLNVGPVDLRALASQVVDKFQPTAETKGVTLSALGEPRIDRLFGDPHRLEMVITNLVGNALKFTPEGGFIRVHVGRAPGGAEVSVSDTGPGIPEAEQPRIFDRFYQVEGSARRRHGGAGIGLALAKELSELHGGRIAVESRPGHGSTFRVFLPEGREHFRPEVLERRRVSVEGHEARRSSDASDGVPEPLLHATASDRLAALEPIVFDDHRRPRVLVAEDQAELRTFVREVLERSFEVLCASDGEEALEMVRRERPDLVLSDVMMPRLAGTDLCRLIKADPALSGIPVILITARVGSDAALEGYAHGADDFVTKPFHTRVLIARVQAQLKLRALSLQVASQARLAAVGTLAAGVAHEVRNPLNAIINAAAALIDSPPPAGSAGARKLLEVIAEGGRRIERITAALDEHAHPAEGGESASVDVRPGIEATLELLEHRRAGVRIEREYETDRRVVASAGELNQVFMNLLDNALRAGSQHIRVRVFEEHDQVIVRISDDGPGVPVEVAERIFDPFFTTRAPGDGTGLGLYLSRRMVLKYGGELRLLRSGVRGAEFSVELPAERVLSGAAPGEGPVSSVSRRESV